MTIATKRATLVPELKNLASEITVGPPQIAINQGHSVLVTDRDGQIPFPSKMGLYFFDTRLISNWTIYANGAPLAVAQQRQSLPLRVPHMS